MSSYCSVIGTTFMFMHKNSENYEEMAEGMRIIKLLPYETKLVTLYTLD